VGQASDKLAVGDMAHVRFQSTLNNDIVCKNPKRMNNKRIDQSSFNPHRRHRKMKEVHSSIEANDGPKHTLGLGLGSLSLHTFSLKASFGLDLGQETLLVRAVVKGSQAETAAEGPNGVKVLVGRRVVAVVRNGRLVANVAGAGVAGLQKVIGKLKEGGHSSIELAFAREQASNAGENKEKTTTFRVGARVYALLEEEDSEEWYEAKIVEARADEGGGGERYDVWYVGFDKLDDNSYEFDLALDRLASPEEFENEDDKGLENEQEDAKRTTGRRASTAQRKSITGLAAPGNNAAAATVMEATTYRKGDQVYGLLAEDEEWYEATVVEVRVVMGDDGSREERYDIEYEGFDDDEAFDLDKPVEDLASPEEFENDIEEEVQEVAKSSPSAEVVPPKRRASTAAQRASIRAGATEQASPKESALIGLSRMLNSANENENEEEEEENAELAGDVEKEEEDARGESKSSSSSDSSEGEVEEDKEPCNKYQEDVNATQFQTCKNCGRTKKDHAAANKPRFSLASRFGFKKPSAAQKGGGGQDNSDLLGFVSSLGVTVKPAAGPGDTSETRSRDRQASVKPKAPSPGDETSETLSRDRMPVKLAQSLGEISETRSRNRIRLGESSEIQTTNFPTAKTQPKQPFLGARNPPPPPRGVVATAAGKKKSSEREAHPALRGVSSSSSASKSPGSSRGSFAVTSSGYDSKIGYLETKKQQRQNLREGLGGTGLNRVNQLYEEGRMREQERKEKVLAEHLRATQQHHKPIDSAPASSRVNQLYEAGRIREQERIEKALAEQEWAMQHQQKPIELSPVLERAYNPDHTTQLVYDASDKEARRQDREQAILDEIEFNSQRTTSHLTSEQVQEAVGRLYRGAEFRERRRQEREWKLEKEAKEQRQQSSFGGEGSHLDGAGASQRLFDQQFDIQSRKEQRAFDFLEQDQQHFYGGTKGLGAPQPLSAEAAEAAAERMHNAAQRKQRNIEERQRKEEEDAQRADKARVGHGKVVKEVSSSLYQPKSVRPQGAIGESAKNWGNSRFLHTSAGGRDKSPRPGVSSLPSNSLRPLTSPRNNRSGGGTGSPRNPRRPAPSPRVLSSESFTSSDGGLSFSVSSSMGRQESRAGGPGPQPSNAQRRSNNSSLYDSCRSASTPSTLSPSSRKLSSPRGQRREGGWGKRSSSPRSLRSDILERPGGGWGRSQSPRSFQRAKPSPIPRRNDCAADLDDNNGIDENIKFAMQLGLLSSSAHSSGMQLEPNNDQESSDQSSDTGSDSHDDFAGDLDDDEDIDENVKFAMQLGLLSSTAPSR
jgi:hypothetical protein